jgi:hypothetical protein
MNYLTQAYVQYVLTPHVRFWSMLSKKSSFWLVVGLITLGRISRFWL